MGYIDLIIHAYVGLILFVAYLSLRRAKSHSQPQKSQEAKEFVTSSPQLKQVVDDVERANEISENSLELLVNALNQQQNLKTNVDTALERISNLESSLRSIGESTQRFDRILGGPQSKGALGEQLVGVRLSDLPHEWYDRNVTFQNGATVEFALRAPNGRWVPIDSKWTSTELLDQLGQTTDAAQQYTLRILVQRDVINRAKEAMKYIDKDSTLGFCIVAVPDAVFELCVDIQAKLTGANIVLISSSLLVPYLLLLVNLYLKEEQASRILEFSNILSRSTSKIELIQEYINRKVIPPLHISSQQQTNYGVQIQGLQDVYVRLSHIQSDLNLLKSMINPVPNADINSIPNTLQRYLTQVQEGLLEAISKQNGQNSDGTTK